jgi:hypothetical protein
MVTPALARLTEYFADRQRVEAKLELDVAMEVEMEVAA